MVRWLEYGHVATLDVAPFALDMVLLNVGLDIAFFLYVDGTQGSSNEVAALARSKSDGSTYHGRRMQSTFN